MYALWYYFFKFLTFVLICIIGDKSMYKLLKRQNH